MKKTQGQFVIFILVPTLMFIFTPPDGATAPEVGAVVEVAQFQQALDALESDSWVMRTEAQEWLFRLAEAAPGDAPFRSAVRERLGDPAVSFEARRVLLRLEDKLGARFEPAGERVPPGDLDRWVGSLTAESPSERQAAEWRVRGALGVVENVSQVLISTRRELSREGLTPGDVEILRKIEAEARYVWLGWLDTPQGREWVPDAVWNPGGESLEAWLFARVEAVAQCEENPACFADVDQFSTRLRESFLVEPGEFPLGGEDVFFPCCERFVRDRLSPTQSPLKSPPGAGLTTPPHLHLWATLHTLEDALAAEAVRPTLTTQIQERLEGGKVTPAGRILLEKLLALCRTYVAVEYWKDGEMWSAQLLEAGVTQSNARLRGDPNTPGTCVDDVGADSVRVVEAASLELGQTPLGCALLHPSGEAFFVLTALDTPGKMLAYPLKIQRDHATRWRQVSRNTCERLWSANRRLTFPELNLMALLHPAEVSDWAVRWLDTWDDAPVVMCVEEFGAARREMTVSHHALLCRALSEVGTQRAVEALMRLHRAGKLDVEIEGATWGKSLYFRGGYWALFGIAARDPWPGVEAWLEDATAENTPLVGVGARPGSHPGSPMVQSQPEDGTPELERGERHFESVWTVRATALGALCERRGVEPTGVGIQPGFMPGFACEQSLKWLTRPTFQAYSDE